MLRANIACQDPKERFSKTDSEKARTRGRYQGDAYAAAPVVGTHIEPAQLSVAREVGVVRRRSSGEPEDCPFFDGHDGPRLQRVTGGEIVARRRIFGPKPIEGILREERAVAHLPRPDG